MSLADQHGFRPAEVACFPGLHVLNQRSVVSLMPSSPRGALGEVKHRSSSVNGWTDGSVSPCAAPRTYQCRLPLGALLPSRVRALSCRHGFSPRGVRHHHKAVNPFANPLHCHNDHRVMLGFEELRSSADVRCKHF